jgi:hypothetical protein
MSHEREGRYRESGGADTPGAAAELAPGKRTLTQALEAPRRAHGFPTDAVQRRLRNAPSTGADPLDAAPIADGLAAAFLAPRAPVQARAGSLADTEPQQIHAAAERGTATPSTSLPYRAELESSLGHDLTGVQAHVGGAAETAAADMGAEAFATGDHVVLPANPSLHTVAHEVAHVVQQRDGVQLKGGVGEVGDAYERQADEVADRVVKRERIAPSGNAGSQAATDSVQLKAEGSATSTVPDGGLPDSEAAIAGEGAEGEGGGGVSVTVTWIGKFGGDLSAKLTIEGTNDDIVRPKKAKKKWAPPVWSQVGQVEVLDPDGPDGPQAAGTATVSVPRFRFYRASIDPVAADPDDRYRDTQVTKELKAADAAVTINKRLNVERWNKKNVLDVWEKKDIDESKASDVVSVPLFGRTVRVNKAVAPRVAKTNALYEALDDEMKLEIQDSLFVVGGYAVRTTSQGGYSNHSVGFALDINYTNKKQNFHFEENDMALLLQLVEPVVQTVPGMKDFDIRDARGVEQLRAAEAFGQQFPAHFAALLERDVPSANASGPDALDPEQVRAAQAKALFDSVSAKDLNAAIEAQKDPVKKEQLRLIRGNLPHLRAWVLGTTVIDKAHEVDSVDRKGDPQRKRVKRKKSAVGMIPLREDVLRMLLDTGWGWGGNWSGEKDYMHFEDTEALSAVQRDKTTDGP